MRRSHSLATGLVVAIGLSASSPAGMESDCLAFGDSVPCCDVAPASFFRTGIEHCPESCTHEIHVDTDSRKLVAATGDGLTPESYWDQVGRCIVNVKECGGPTTPGGCVFTGATLEHRCELWKEHLSTTSCTGEGGGGPVDE